MKPPSSVSTTLTNSYMDEPLRHQGTFGQLLINQDIQVHSNRARRNHKTPNVDVYSRTDEDFHSSSNSTSLIMNIPTEIRSKIFSYLLPEKRRHIVPTTVLQAQKTIEKSHLIEEAFRNKQRFHRQQVAFNNFLPQSSFYPAINRSVSTDSASSTEIDFQFPMNFSFESFGDVFAMPGMRGSSFDRIFEPSTMSTPLSSTRPRNTYEPIYVKPVPHHPSLNKNIRPSDWASSTTFSNLADDGEEVTTIPVHIPEDNDCTPENMTLNLLTTHSLFCIEISTILYEEYTFEIHVHPDGVDFLHFPRIKTFEYGGNELQKRLSAFQANGQFCLQRMKHLSILLFGGDPAVRTAGWRMRMNVETLVGMMGKLASLEVVFVGESSFWKVENRPRMGTCDASVVEMVCSPLAARLKGVGRVSVQLPVELERDKGLLEWAGWLEVCVKGKGEVNKDGVLEMMEVAMVDATIEFEYRKAFVGPKQVEDWVWMDVDTEVAEEMEEP